MKTAIAIHDNFPVDRQVRTRRITRTLDEAGEEVVVFARNTRTDPARGQVDEQRRPREEQLAHALVKRFSWLASTPLYGLISTPVPFNPFWTLWLALEFRRQGVDVVVAGDIRVAIPAAIAGRLTGAPLVLDLREHYVGLARSLPADDLLNRVAQTPWVVGRIEWISVQVADAVWVVVEERRDQLVAQGVPAEKVRVVSNTPDLGDQQNRLVVDGGEDAGAVDGSTWARQEFTLVYVGVINEFRGLKLVIDALAELDGTDVDAHFMIAGEGPHRAALEERAQRRGVADQVTFLGWIDSERVPSFLGAGDVGVIPHHVTEFTDHTVPNKLFDCMMVGLPVLTTDMDPVQRIVEAASCGYVLPPNATTADMADGVHQLAAADVEALGANGRAAVVSQYNWSRDAERVLETVRQLAG
jgi:glycosyltransferase involved in cell wall biosynthesis